MTTLLEMRGITKTFPGVRAGDHVNLMAEADEIHAICGENGVGKSTVMKVLSGVYPNGSSTGEIWYQGRLLGNRDIADSEARGIIIIHQELALVPLLSIAENLFLGKEVSRNGVINWPLAFQKTGELLAKDVCLLILDEPPTALQENDSRKPLDLLLDMKVQGITSILISRKLNKISQVADRITIIRDDATVLTLTKSEISEDRIISDVVGHDMAHRYSQRTPEIGAVLMQVEGLNLWHPEQHDHQMIKDAAFNLRKGEIVGIARLMGADRTELDMRLFG